MIAPAAPTRERSVFSPIAAVWMVLVGVISFAGLLVLSAYAPQLRNGDDGGAHALSRSALGFAGAVRLLKAQGEPVLVSRGPLRGGRPAGAAILTPTFGMDADAVEDVELAGPKLIVLPKWRARPHQTHRGWVQNASLADPKAVAKSLLAPYAPNSLIERRRAPVRPRLYRTDGAQAEAFATPGSIDALQTFTGQGWAPVIVDETGHMVAGRVGQTYVLSDPDLLNTRGIKDIRTARAGLAIVELVREGDEPIVFDVTLHGYERGRSFLRLAFEPPFLGVTLCLVAAALLIGLHAATRFGPAIRPPRAFALGKQALADNTAGLIRMARREHAMGGRYAAACRAAVARAIGAPKGLDEAGLDAFLDWLSEKAGLTPYTDLAAQAKGAARPAEMLTAARNLHHWRVEMSRERR